MATSFGSNAAIVTRVHCNFRHRTWIHSFWVVWKFHVLYERSIFRGSILSWEILLTGTFILNSTTVQRDCYKFSWQYIWLCPLLMSRICCATNTILQFLGKIVLLFPYCWNCKCPSLIPGGKSLFSRKIVLRNLSQLSPMETFWIELQAVVSEQTYVVCEYLNPLCKRPKCNECQCMPNKGSNQPAHPCSLIRVSVFLGYPKCSQWRFWSDCTFLYLHSLIWIFAGCACSKVRFLILRLQ